MVDLLGLLPILNGWNWVRLKDDTQIKTTDSPKEVYSTEEPMFGWVIDARMSSDVSDVTLRVRYDPVESGQTLDFDLNPEQLYTSGYYYRSNLPYVSNYDPVNSQYAAEYSPKPPLAIKGDLTVSVLPGSSDATVNYDVTILEVTDIEAFVESLRAVFGIGTIIDLLNSLTTPEMPKAPIELPKVTVKEYTGFLP